MQRVTFHHRKAVQIETAKIRVTITEEGGHIAEIFNKSTGVNPLWIPPWPSIEPSTWSEAAFPEYGPWPEAKLLSGILGHNLCVDVFGMPSKAEQDAGVCIHGEAGLVPWHFEEHPGGLRGRCELPLSRLAVERVITLDGARMTVKETIENLDAYDRPIAWTQHVTLGPPFLDRGKTELWANGNFAGSLPGGTDPHSGTVFDKPGPEFRETLPAAEGTGGFRSFMMEKGHDRSFFIAWSPALETAISYSWKREDFPWIGIWEENNYRDFKPWNSRTLSRGLEFGVTPFAETRREMIERGSLFGTPGFKWIPAKSKVTAEYFAQVAKSAKMPASIAEFDALAK